MAIRIKSKYDLKEEKNRIHSKLVKERCGSKKETSVEKISEPKKIKYPECIKKADKKITSLKESKLWDRTQKQKHRRYYFNDDSDEEEEMLPDKHFPHKSSSLPRVIDIQKVQVRLPRLTRDEINKATNAEKGLVESAEQLNKGIKDIRQEIDQLKQTMRRISNEKEDSIEPSGLDPTILQDENIEDISGTPYNVVKEIAQELLTRSDQAEIIGEPEEKLPEEIIQFTEEEISFYEGVTDTETELQVAAIEEVSQMKNQPEVALESNLVCTEGVDLPMGSNAESEAALSMEIASIQPEKVMNEEKDPQPETLFEGIPEEKE